MTIATNIAEHNPPVWKIKEQCRALHIRYAVHDVGDQKKSLYEYRFGDGSGINVYRNGMYQVCQDIKVYLPEFA